MRVSPLHDDETVAPVEMTILWWHEGQTVRASARISHSSQLHFVEAAMNGAPRSCGGTDDYWYN